MKNGLVHIYIGSGKGKTTAAIGLAVRALGAGQRVGVCQFLKDGTSSELAVMQTLSHCTVFPCPAHVPFTFCMTPDEKQTLAAFYEQQMATLGKHCATYDLLILDEVLDAVQTGLLDEGTLLTFVKTRPAHTELVLTGHSVPKAILPLAHYITDMHAVRHPYTDGVAARRGIEY